MSFVTTGKALIAAAILFVLLVITTVSHYLNLPIVTANEIVTGLIMVLTFATGGSAILAYLADRRLQQWLKQIASYVAEVDRGRYNAELPRANAVGPTAVMLQGALVDLFDYFRLTVSRLNDAASGVTAMSVQMNDNSRNLVGTVETQANGAIETTATVAQIMASIDQTCEDIGKLTNAAEEVSSAIMEMAANNEEVAQSMNRLMVAIDQVSSSITEMSASIHEIDGNVEALNYNTGNAASSIAQMDQSIKQIQENIQNAASYTTTVLKDAEAGKSAVESIISKSDQMQNSSAIALQAVGELSRRTVSIDAIMRVIDEVAEQTNLLALNASIIAAQAGAHGNSFAIVANEIKNLAQKTKKSTSEIYVIINGVQSETQQVDTIIRAIEAQIREGVTLSTFSGEALAKIVQGVRNTNDQVVLVAQATKEQAAGSHTIRAAMENISGMVNQLARSAREQSTASDLIHASTVQMRDHALQINNSTREQSSASALIAKLAEVMRQKMETAKESCQEQLAGSNKIQTDITLILETCDQNLDIVRSMDQAVAQLSQQAVDLQHNREFYS